jgi:hypothetical protein
VLLEMEARTMPEIARINMQTARFDPQREFGSPDKLAACVAMTRGQKIASLERWSMQVHERHKACAAGRPSECSLDADLQLLVQIRAALVALKAP